MIYVRTTLIILALVASVDFCISLHDRWRKRHFVYPPRIDWFAGLAICLFALGAWLVPA